MKQETTGKQFAESADKVITVTRKQTAVEWMVEQVELISNNKTLSKKDAVKLYDEVIQQTKEMFEEQIMEAYMKAKLEHIDTLGLNAVKNKIIKDTEQYFQETYGGDKC